MILYGYQKEQDYFVPKNAGKYIVIYSYDKNLNYKEDIKAIKTFAKKNGLKIYSCGYHHKWCDKNINCDPYKLLGYFKNSAFIITNTFHGAVISLITNSQMIVKLTNNKK